MAVTKIENLINPQVMADMISAKITKKIVVTPLQRYNDKQKRADRKIKNYYKKICNSKQEKPFHEVILQIGDMNSMSSHDENGELAKEILIEYYKDFQARNPSLRVFSAHIHMDEATPHIHIDFVPFITGSKRGLDTRVSLKQALAAQGFKGGTRQDTEWSQWVLSEKEQLAMVMERYGVEWEHRGTHEKHLSVLDYKKQEREKELEALDEQIAEKNDEFKSLSERVRNYDEGYQSIREIAEEIDKAPEFQLPEPTKFMSVKSYKEKIVEPLIDKLKSFIKTLVARAFEGWDNYHRINKINGDLYQENKRLIKTNDKLTEENKYLRDRTQDYRLLRKVFGNKQIDDLLNQARTLKQSNRRNVRTNNYNNER